MQFHDLNWSVITRHIVDEATMNACKKVIKTGCTPTELILTMLQGKGSLSFVLGYANQLNDEKMIACEIDKNVKTQNEQNRNETGDQEFMYQEIMIRNESKLGHLKEDGKIGCSIAHRDGKKIILPSGSPFTINPIHINEYDVLTISYYDDNMNYKKLFCATNNIPRYKFKKRKGMKLEDTDFLKKHFQENHYLQSNITIDLPPAYPWNEDKYTVLNEIVALTLSSE